VVSLGEVNKPSQVAVGWPPSWAALSATKWLRGGISVIGGVKGNVADISTGTTADWWLDGSPVVCSPSNADSAVLFLVLDGHVGILNNKRSALDGASERDGGGQWLRSESKFQEQPTPFHNRGQNQN
jgi:hypothetical protein